MLRNSILCVVAGLHLYFLILEMYFWAKPLGLKVFRHSAENAKASAVLAANQGLYNGFLAAGLVWSVFHPNADVSRQLALFFLGCVIAAGMYGAYSVNRKIFYVQALPAIVGLLVTLWS